MLALDSRTNAFTVYTRTEYGDILISAIKANNDRRYDEASTYWQKILQRNNNFDSAYVGLGKASYRSSFIYFFGKKPTASSAVFAFSVLGIVSGTVFSRVRAVLRIALSGAPAGCDLAVSVKRDVRLLHTHIG